MPRASSEDFLQNFRFHVTMNLAAPESGTDPLKTSAADGGVAGFQSCSHPAFSVNAAEYRTGIAMFTYKQPGIPTTEDVTLMRGVTRRDTSFLDWMLRYLRGNAYRVDMIISTWDQTGQPADSSGRNPNDSGFSEDHARRILLFDAFPINAKPGGDFEATSDEIHVGELTVAYENFEIEQPINNPPAQQEFVGG